MIDAKELDNENQEIIDLAAIISALIDKPEHRKNPVFCELLKRFMAKINAHLTHEARSVYSDLLNDSNKDTNKVASRFISNSHELKKILKGYSKRWCVAITSTEDHQRFVEETNEIFRLLNERIDLEKSHLLPLLAK